MFAFLCCLPQWAFIAALWEFLFRAVAAILAGKVAKVDFLKLLWGLTGVPIVLGRSDHWISEILAMLLVAFVQIHLAQGSNGPTTAGHVKSYLFGVWTRLCEKCGDGENNGG